MNDPEFFARVNTRVTRAALERLNHACVTRGRSEAAHVPQGRILVELIMAHLEPTPDEIAAARKPARAARAVPQAVAG
jgi:hypothetical protein